MEKIRNKFPYDYIYPQQEQLMLSIYECIESSSIGFFESPTGTGKSLSVACSALSWLLEEEDKIIQNAEKRNCDANEQHGDWIVNMMKSYQSKPSDLTQDSLAFYKYLQQQILKEKIDIDNNFRKYTIKKYVRNMYQANETDISENDDEFILDNYNSDESNSKKKSHIEYDEGERSIVELNIPQIFYSSRTHTQISQFLDEIKKCDAFKNIRSVALGSRRNLCINSKLDHIQSDAVLSEKCLELNKQKKKKNKNPAQLKKDTSDTKSNMSNAANGCEYHNRALEERLSLSLLGSIADLEEAAGLGMKRQACPYYATRRSVASAQLVCLPYNMLLCPAMRAALGINLTGAVVIFDEAHNLVDAVQQLHSAEVSVAQLQQVLEAVHHHLHVYSSRLSGKSVYHLTVLAAVTTALSKETTRCSDTSAVMSVNEFLFKAKLDSVNLLRLLAFIDRSRVAEKLGGCMRQASRRALEASEPSPKRQRVPFADDSVQAVQRLCRLVASLSLPDGQGAVVVSAASIRYVHCDAAPAFEQLLQARSVLLLGGTLQPFASLAAQLRCPPHRLTSFSCGHITPAANIAALTVPSLSFTHDQKLRPETVSGLLNLLVELSGVVPAGLVVFLTSYHYLAELLRCWEGAGGLRRLEANKRVFVEVRGGDIDSLWRGYCSAAAGGALLLCVVGGRLSEGINFKDDLCRAVIMVGMPFADRREVTTQLQLQQGQRRGGTSEAQLYLEMCMRGVNQSIGRAIRHRGDYAMIVLVDRRYSDPSVRRLLPRWVGEGVCDCDGGVALRRRAETFFRLHQTSVTGTCFDKDGRGS